MSKKIKNKRKRYSWIMFWIFSAVLFINNTNQLLQTYTDLTYSQLSFISFAGIIGSLAYVLWLKD